MTTTIAGFPGLSLEALGLLMPMFLWVDRDGIVRGVGPTLAKILEPGPILDVSGKEHFILRLAPTQRGGAMAVFPNGTEVPLGGRRLHLVVRRRPEIVLRGAAVGLGPSGRDGVLFNLTLGIHLAEAVREFGLTEGDFSAADLAIELLYMGEANAAVLGELSALTGRLDMARRTAVAQASSDPLTGLANRRGFDKSLADAIEAQLAEPRPFAVAHVDLDYFKAVNDTFGHAAGDQVLMRVGMRLSHELRRGDLAARTGGDEFLLLLHNADDRDSLQRLGDRLIHRLEEPFEFEGKMSRISASIGIAVSTGYGPEAAAQLLADADRALYAAKRAGRGRCMLFSPELSVH